jgi:hypothetical protein
VEVHTFLKPPFSVQGWNEKIIVGGSSHLSFYWRVEFSIIANGGIQPPSTYGGNVSTIRVLFVDHQYWWNSTSFILTVYG